VNVLSDSHSGSMFYFYVDVGVYADRCATSLADFCNALEDIDTRSIEFHMGRGNFEKWVNSLGEHALAKEIARLNKKASDGESLRTKLRDAVNKRLNRWVYSECNTFSPESLVDLTPVFSVNNFDSFLLKTARAHELL